MHRPIHITATWGDPPAASTIGIHVSEWRAIVRDDHPVTIIGPSDGDTPAVIWEFQRQRVVICDAVGRRLYRTACTRRSAMPLSSDTHKRVSISRPTPRSAGTCPLRSTSTLNG
jgi:hypothetical protein